MSHHLSSKFVREFGTRALLKLDVFVTPTTAASTSATPRRPAVARLHAACASSQVSVFTRWVPRERNIISVFTRWVIVPRERNIIADDGVVRDVMARHVKAIKDA